MDVGLVDGFCLIVGPTARAHLLDLGFGLHIEEALLDDEVFFDEPVANADPSSLFAISLESFSAGSDLKAALGVISGLDNLTSLCLPPMEAARFTLPGEDGADLLNSTDSWASSEFLPPLRTAAALFIREGTELLPFILFSLYVS